MATIDFEFFLSELKKGEIMDETYFYFVDETDKPEHYIGCLSQYDKPYWVGLCDIPDGTEFLTAEELVNAKVCEIIEKIEEPKVEEKPKKKKKK